MRWKAISDKAASLKHGDFTIVKRFALWPTLMSTDEYVWLQSYYAIR